MSIHLTPTVLVRIPEAAMQCCRLAWMKEMALTITRAASSSSYFFLSDLAPRRENVACPIPLKGLQPSLSNTVTEAASMLSNRRTPLDFSLRSYSPVPSVQTLVQPAKPQQVPLRILRRARKPGHHSLVGGKSIQAHYLEPEALPGHQGR